MAAPKRITPNQGDAPSDTTPAAPSSLSLLAQEQFGDQYHGDVEETPRPTPPPRDPDETPDLPEIPDEDLDEAGRNVQVEGDDVEPSLPDEAAADADQPIATVRELVEHLEADPAWFDGLKVDVTVNDKTSQVPLKELIDNYQIREAADARLELAKTKSAQAQQEAQERNAVIDLQYETAAKLVLASEQKLMAEAVGIDWDRLKAEDPAMWSAERVRVGERASEIQQMKQQTAQQYQQAVMQRHQEQEQHKAATLAEQSQLLMQNMPKVSPDWGDAARAPEAKGRLATYLVGQGFTPKEIEDTLDHRNFIVAEKARLWDESQGKLQLTKKRIRTVPKVMRPGAGREPSTVSLEKVRKAQQQLRKSGRIDDALTALRLLREKRS